MSPRSFVRPLPLLAVAAALALPAGAQAAATVHVDTVAPTEAGCQVKGLNVLPAAGAAVPPGTAGNLSTGVYAYTVTAVTAGGEVAPACAPIAVAVDNDAQQDSALLDWSATPGAVGYKIYRAQLQPTQSDAQALIFGGGPGGPVTTLPATSVCPPGGDGSGTRCAFLDRGGPTLPTATPPAQPAALTAAGSHPDFEITERFDYGGADANTPATSAGDDPYPTEDGKPATLKTNVFHLPPGFNPNPTATKEICKLTGENSLLGATDKFGSDDANEDKCPRSSRVGTVRTFTRTPQGIIPTVGDIYNGETKGSEAARIFIVLRPSCSAGSFVAPGSATCTAAFGSPNVQVEKEFFAGIANLVKRSDGTYGIDVATVSAEDDGAIPSALTLLAPTGSGGALERQSTTVPIQVRQITQRLFGSADQGTADTTDDLAFVTLPTSCGEKTVSVDATTYVDDTVRTGSKAFTTDACEALLFAPVVTATLDGTGGQTQKLGHPALTVNVTQRTGEAASASSRLILPSSVSSNLAGLAVTCTEDQLASGQCPASAAVGAATAISPLLPTALSGPVIPVAQAGGLPKLAVLLSGRISLRLDGTIELDTTTTPGAVRIVNRFDSIPDVPLTSFTLSFRGGANGLLTNERDLCQGAGNIEGTFTGHNGKTSPVNTPITVVPQTYCLPTPNVAKPKASARISKLRTRRPSLRLTVTRKGVTGTNRLKTVRWTLPKGLKGVKSKLPKGLKVTSGGKRLKRSAYKLKGRVLTISKLGSTGSTAVKATFARGTLRATSRLARRGRTKTRVTFKVRSTDRANKRYSSTLRVRPKS